MIRENANVRVRSFRNGNIYFKPKKKGLKWLSSNQLWLLLESDGYRKESAIRDGYENITVYHKDEKVLVTDDMAIRESLKTVKPIRIKAERHYPMWVDLLGE